MPSKYRARSVLPAKEQISKAKLIQLNAQSDQLGIKKVELHEQSSRYHW